ncbi:YicC/YloC family endoribonuclease [Rheinheimera sp. MMS21-TC3]|uniref:YicC/YloC family endoribonuclease n=1 Tax=Rheinheimera sp. MMS21-TC3 TaxID=3072790 RepID=UPI0028C4A10B|nr:YicC/YloC family endoribonuclease [Rheinheimera sp. MMS21-TC3]WNO59929.1 YicC/YloC family endoribonuclease [Rheinheimera sp. MMS21-TC3]
MIHSMTAFARHETNASWGSAQWEIRSVNQRYLETYFRLPEQFRGLENLLRDKLRAKLNRGKVEVNLRFHANQAAGELNINHSFAEQLLQQAQLLLAKAPQAQLNIADIMRWPGVMETPNDDIDAIQKELLAGFDAALQDFLAGRGREGDAIEQMITQRLTGITEQVSFVRSHLPQAMQWQRDRIVNRLTEIKAELDQSRLEQEMAFIASKSDVAEELDRLDAHIKETQHILKKGGACGRRLDFMMQEFNREANTLSSKAISTEITNAAVELKVLIEQMREQIQNVE